MSSTRIKVFAETAANDTVQPGGEFESFTSYNGSVSVGVHIGSPDLVRVSAEHADDAKAHWVSMRSKQNGDVTLFVHHEAGSIETARQLAFALLKAAAAAEVALEGR